MTESIPPQSLRPWSPEWYALQKSTLGESTCQQLGFYVIPPELRLSVVIPVYNEEKTLRLLIDKVREVPIRKELILIDDC
ncbi:MAG: glycosyltransferase, partial [Planctomycetota bacterium]|nr:glycosyltransferase [Planctomycetota bacterium]